MNRTMIAFAFVASVAAGTAEAQTVVALLDGGTMLASVDGKALKAGKPVTVSGVAGRLVGIDVRPADGMLYGLFEDGTLATLDPATGAATVKAKLDTMLPRGVTATVDFNPVADRLRVIGSDGTNLRVNVDDGKVVKDGALRYADGDMHKGATPNVVAGAYTNSVKGAKETALFDVDGALAALVKQAPPNDGILNAVGAFGIKAPTYAFDIATTDAGNEGWLMAGDTLYRVELATGKAKAAGKVSALETPVRDIAILPAM
ncbi:uncharacterized protein DUF4394 [Azorhizobium sp. AG788]|uniref:DUF4394 domain-containing protein n=1 Tax=Azorhizobium sp. AG788 TaxID=2183897 RepID=UPI00105C5320|nr:DUF4394 domain-containing protein [Azorhizobium sp. AG788]TDU00972.1 uncharacterized protein DUF4394 [Azorhizobium sp. AG788]